MRRINGVIRDYDWGDQHALAGILGHEFPGHPEAEYWLGAHPSAPSTVDGGAKALDGLIDAEAEAAVGAAVWRRFGRLPFLLKILAAAGPLSIQAHPSLEQARKGFARENAAGIDRAAKDRNYRDDNHKPELICAITPFEAKCGFRSVDKTNELFSLFSGPDVAQLCELLNGDDPGQALARTVQWLLQLPADAGTAFSGEITEQAKQLLGPTSQSMSSTASVFAAELEWTVKIGTDFPGDIGVVVALLLNHVSLAPGQAMFLEAGNLHSYLQGVGIELMANSDNVLRGGLTSKHVDVDELLSVVHYEPTAAPIQTPAGPVHRFDSPVPEFSLIRLGDSASRGFPEADSFEVAAFAPDGPSIVLLTAGRANITSATGSLELHGGEAAFVTASEGPFQVTDTEAGVTIAWVATVGSN